MYTHTFLLLVLAEYSSGCDGPLGLQSGAIPDRQISSSLHDSNPQHGRLNHPDSAWCFLYSQVQREGQEVFLEVDLGRPQLLSGLQTQGPPAALYPASYMRYISLAVELSMDGLSWTDCCSEDAETKTNFYADDKNDELGTVSTHAFSDLVVARYVRIRVSTGLRWIGHDNKCFRFELLGCSEESRGETELSVTPQSAGYIAVSWKQPVVRLPEEESHSVHTSYFLLNLSHQQDGRLVSSVINTTDTSHNVASPVWGTEYSIVLTCWVHHRPLKCGQLSIIAQPRPSLACRAHSAFCLGERLVFVTPRLITARLRSEDEVEISWNTTSGGWRVPETLVVVEDPQWQRKVLTKTVRLSSRESLVVSGGLEADKTYQVMFYPRGLNIPTDTVQSVFSLRLLRSGDQLLAFLSDLGLEASVVWSGGLRVTWRQAVARAEPDLRLEADMYRVVVRVGDTEPSFLLATNLSGAETSHQLGGLSLGQVYTVSLTCVWGRVEVSCGQERITTSPPSLVEGSQVLSLLPSPASWQESEAQCQAGGGHLVSLGQEEEEDLLTSVLSQAGSRDVWTGGNMCPDSPAPRDSLWSDGSHNTHTNFAGHPGLAAGRCCIYRTDTGWRGGLCHDLKLGVCETHVEAVISHPEVLSVTSGRGLLAVRWERSQEGWTPSRWLVSCCFATNILTQEVDQQEEDCISEMLLSKAVGVIFKKLATFSEYKITLTSYLDNFNQTQSSHQFGRTLPDQEFNWTISLDGRLHLTWLRKFSLYQEDNPVDISWLAENESGSSNGSSRLVTIPSLSLGKTYTTTLMDLKDEDKLTTFTFTAYPNCSLGSGVGLKCVHWLPSGSFSEAEERCGELEMKLWPGPARDLAQVNKKIEAELDGPVWVRAETESLYEEERATQTQTVEGERPCKAWSREDQLQPKDCSTSLPAVCIMDMSDLLVFPAPHTDLSIKHNSETLNLTRLDTASGWKVDYSLQAWHRDNQSRSARDLFNSSGNENKILLRDNISLEMNDDYVISIISTIGDVKREFKLEDILRHNSSLLSLQYSEPTLSLDIQLLMDLIVTSILIICLSFTLVVLVMSQTMLLYKDNLAQFGFQTLLLVSQIIPLLTLYSGSPSEDQLSCLMTMAGLYISYLGCGIFLLLESLIVLTSLSTTTTTNLLTSTWFILTSGLASPLLYTILSFSALQPHQVQAEVSLCWAEVTSPPASLFLLPTVLLGLASLTILLLSYPQQNLDTPRSETVSTNRHSVLGTVVLMVLVTTLGPVVHTISTFSPLLCGCYQLARAALAVAVIVRTLNDSQVIARIKRGYLKCEETNVVYGAQLGQAVTVASDLAECKYSPGQSNMCRVPCSKNSYNRSTNSTPFPTPATVSVFSLYKMYEQLSRKSSSTSTFQISPDSSRPESSSSRGPPPPSPLVASANISSLQYFTARPSLPHTPDYLDMDQ